MKKLSLLLLVSSTSPSLIMAMDAQRTPRQPMTLGEVARVRITRNDLVKNPERLSLAKVAAGREHYLTLLDQIPQTNSREYKKIYTQFNRWDREYKTQLDQQQETERRFLQSQAENDRLRQQELIKLRERYTSQICQAITCDNDFGLVDNLYQLLKDTYPENDSEKFRIEREYESFKKFVQRIEIKDEFKLAQNRKDYEASILLSKKLLETYSPRDPEYYEILDQIQKYEQQLVSRQEYEERIAWARLTEDEELIKQMYCNLITSYHQNDSKRYFIELEWAQVEREIFEKKAQKAQKQKEMQLDNLKKQIASELAQNNLVRARTLCAQLLRRYEQWDPEYSQVQDQYDNINQKVERTGRIGQLSTLIDASPMDSFENHEELIKLINQRRSLYKAENQKEKHNQDLELVIRLRRSQLVIAQSDALKSAITRNINDLHKEFI